MKSVAHPRTFASFSSTCTPLPAHPQARKRQEERKRELAQRRASPGKFKSPKVRAAFGLWLGRVSHRNATSLAEGTTQARSPTAL